MKRIALISTSIILLALDARAGGIEDVKFCQADTDRPTRAAAMAAPDPQGHPRGTRSAAVLYAEARKAALAGKDDEAISWLVLCQWHNQGAADKIRSDKADVIAYLKR